MLREVALDARCPSCKAPQLTLRTLTEDLPFLGETLLTTVECTRCDFKHSAQVVLRQREPMRHTLRVEGEADLGARVVRSPSGTYRVPELGFVAEPAEASEAFVSNVEGVLERVRDVLVRARLMFPEAERQRRAEELLAKVERAVAGKEAVTLILEDPFGNSAILSDKATAERLTEDEVALLRTGVVLLEQDDLTTE